MARLLLFSQFPRAAVSRLCYLTACTFIVSSQSAAQFKVRPVAGYADVPLTFERNQGQADPALKYLARGIGYRAGFSTSGVRVVLAPSRETPPALIQLTWANATRHVSLSGVDPVTAKTHYLIGSDRSHWRTNIPNSAKVRYEGLYPGIDVVFYGRQKELEYDIVLAPGADPNRIEMQVEGAKARLSPDGDLELATSAGTLIHRKPDIFQETGTGKSPVRGRYVLRGEGRIGFEIESYDPAKPLVIDPVLTYAVALLTERNSMPEAIAADREGCAYITGWTEDPNWFPTTPGAFQDWVPRESTHAFVSKLNAQGTAFEYSTYFGGNNQDYGRAIAVDGSGHAYIAGSTRGDFYGFPVTPGAYREELIGPSDRWALFVAKLTPAGDNLVYSTLLGGPEEDKMAAIAVDPAGNAYVAGTAVSTGFPSTSPLPGGIPSLGAAFVAKLNPTGSALVYSVLLSGPRWSSATGIAVDASGAAFVCGSSAAGFPTTPEAFQRTAEPYNSHAFAAKLSPSGSTLEYSTLLAGGFQEEANGIALDPAGNAYVVGTTGSHDFPVTPGAFRAPPMSSSALFVSKLNPTGTGLVYSTLVGRAERRASIAVDIAGRAYVAGNTVSAEFPVTPDAVISQKTNDPSSIIGFFSILNPGGNALVYSSYWYSASAIAVDAAQQAYIAGYTSEFVGVSEVTVAKVATGGCTFSLDSNSITVPATASSGRIDLSTGVGCLWNSSADVDWITLSRQRVTQSGPGFDNFTVAANPSALPRTGSFQMGGRTVRVTQAGTACPMFQSSLVADGARQTVTIPITASGPCTWTAASNSAWLTFEGPAPMSPRASISLTIAQNPLATARTGTLRIGADTLTVTQQGTTPVFADVPLGHPYFDPINRMWQRGLTVGCRAEPRLYCPEATITRSQMAVFIVRALLGGDSFAFNPTPVFADVPATHPHFRWVQKMWEMRITRGCSATEYCPENPVTRGQMAAFIIRGRIGWDSYRSASLSTFQDVEKTDEMAFYIDIMKEQAITVGCAKTLYCPDSPVTRGQMAVFVMRGLLNEFLPARHPVIESVSPTSASRGETVTMTIKGRNTHFLNGNWIWIQNISIESLNTSSDTETTVRFTISAWAMPGVYSVVDNPWWSPVRAVLPAAFTIY